MDMRNQFLIYRILIAILIFFIFSFAADPVAFVLKSSGKVDFIHADETRAQRARKGTVLYDGDKVKTGEASFCAITFPDDKSLLRIKENSTCTIEGKKEEDKTNKNIIAEVGTFFTRLFRPRGSFSVTTPTSVASVKGTEWWTIQMEDGRTIYIVTENMINILSEAGQFLVREGQTAIFTSPTANPQIIVTEPGSVPTWDEEAGDYKVLEIEFIDADGKKQNLRIDYLEQ